MVFPEGPPPLEHLFEPGSNLLVRAPPTPATALRLRGGSGGSSGGDGGSGSGSGGGSGGVVSRVPGGLGRIVEFETDLFVGKMLVRGGPRPPPCSLSHHGFTDARAGPCARPHRAAAARARAWRAAPALRQPRGLEPSPPPAPPRQVLFRMPPEQQDHRVAELLEGRRRRMWVSARTPSGAGPRTRARARAPRAARQRCSWPASGRRGGCRLWAASGAANPPQQTRRHNPASRPGPWPPAPSSRALLAPPPPIPRGHVSADATGPPQARHLPGRPRVRWAGHDMGNGQPQGARGGKGGGAGGGGTRERASTPAPGCDAWVRLPRGPRQTRRRRGLRTHLPAPRMPSPPCATPAHRQAPGLRARCASPRPPSLRPASNGSPRGGLRAAAGACSGWPALDCSQPTLRCAAWRARAPGLIRPPHAGKCWGLGLRLACWKLTRRAANCCLPLSRASCRRRSASQAGQLPPLAAARRQPPCHGAPLRCSPGQRLATLRRKGLTARAVCRRLRRAARPSLPH
jgi:hypothetical protein